MDVSTTASTLACMSTRLQKQATLELEELLSIVGFDTADGKISFDTEEGSIYVTAWQAKGLPMEGRVMQTGWDKITPVSYKIAPSTNFVSF